MSEHPFSDLGARTRGPVILPDDPDFHSARKVRNGMIDRMPLAVVRAWDEADVMTTVRFAGNEGLALAIRGGGHGVSGYGTCDGGVVLDLSGIRNVRVDPDAKTARAGGGALLGDLDHATYPFGLATPSGFNSTTGLGGLTLGGGISAYLGRKYGLTCDNLSSADVVTADGSRVTASAQEHPDLFWALRGGGGNFGVVTSFEFRLHPVKDIVGGPIFYPMDAAEEVVRFYQDYIHDAPRELGGFVGFHRAPPLPFIPEEHHGDPVCIIVVCWSGAPEQAKEILEVVRGAGPVIAEHVDTMPYPALQSAFDALIPAGLQNYWKADFTGELSDEAISAYVAHAPGLPSVHSAVHLYPMDGAVRDVSPEATAFPFRDVTFAVNIVGMWEDPSENDTHTAWVKDHYAAVHPYSGYEAGYTNFMAADDEGRARENYGPAYDRLRQIKAEYDPNNLFRLNQNVSPAGS